MRIACPWHGWEYDLETGEYSQFMLAHAFIPGNLGDRMVAGRIKTDLDQVLPAGEHEGMGYP